MQKNSVTDIAFKGGDDGTAYGVGNAAFRAAKTSHASFPNISDKIYNEGKSKLASKMDDYYVNKDLEEAQKYDPETRVGGSYRDDS